MASCWPTHRRTPEVPSQSLCRICLALCTPVPLLPASERLDVSAWHYALCVPLLPASERPGLSRPLCTGGQDEIIPTTVYGRSQNVFHKFRNKSSRQTVPLLSEAAGANPVWINLTRRTHHSFMEVMLSSMNEVQRDGDRNMVTFKFSCNPDRVCSRCRAVSRPRGWDLWVSGRVVVITRGARAWEYTCLWLSAIGSWLSRPSPRCG